MSAAVVSGLAAASRRRRLWTNRVACALLGTTVIVALGVLLLVLGYTVARGAGRLSLGFLTHSMKGVGPLDKSGGVYHSVVGTIEQVGIAALLSIPLGLLVAIYIVEYGTSRLSTGVRFLVDVMTGVPSIVAGLFVFAFWVLGLHQGFSGLAASLALAVLMLPVVVRSSEEMLRLVPTDLREASYALGVPRWRTVLSVVLPTASGGITTGIVLAIARVTGETAPLLVTAFGFDAIKTSPFKGPQSNLSLFVFQNASSAFEVAVQRAWAAALTLIVVVLVLITAARLLGRLNRVQVRP